VKFLVRRTFLCFEFFFFSFSHIFLIRRKSLSASPGLKRRIGKRFGNVLSLHRL
jgi:hypothetical protein